MKKNVSLPEKDSPLMAIRLTARILGTIWVTLILSIAIGYFMEGIERNGGEFKVPTDWLGVAVVLFLMIGLAGLIVAFWREGAGVLISTSGFSLSALFLIINPKLHFSLFFFILILVPSMLYLVYWLGLRNFQKKHP
jgi:hypothetical protein